MGKNGYLEGIDFNSLKGWMKQMYNIVEWGHWGLTFYKTDNLTTRKPIEFFGKLYFPVGPQGPMDGTYGSPLRQKFEKACRDWKNGICPDGTTCELDQKRLYV
jgi:hypothetical protein